MEEPEVLFFGICVPPEDVVEVEDSFDSDQTILATVHVTQISLGEAPKAGRHTVFAHTDEGEKFPLGTLEKQRCEQFQVDYMLPPGLKLSHSGSSPIYLTGYKTITNLLDPGLEYSSDEEKQDDEDEDDEDQEAPNAVPLQQSLLEGKEFSDMDDSGEADDEENEEEDDSDEEDEGKIAKPATARRGEKVLVPVAASDSDEDVDVDDEDEDDEDEDVEDDDDDDDDDDDEPALPRVTAKAGTKRPTTDSRLTTLAKKVKVPEQQAGPSSAPAKPSTSEGDSDAQYMKALQVFLAKEGATKLSVLGSQVKKPPGVSKKLKQLLSSNTKTFKIDNDQLVSLL